MDNQSGKSPPKLKIVEDSPQSEDIHRLNQTEAETKPARKRAHLRRSQEATALTRDLKERQTPLPQESPDLEAQIEEATPKEALRIPPGFFIVIAGAFLLLLGLGVFLATGGRDRQKTDRLVERSRENLQLNQQEKAEARSLVDKLTLAVQGYTSATTVAEKLVYARQPERVAPLMEEYYQRRELIPLNDVKLVDQHAIPVDDRSFSGLTISYDGSKQKLLLVELDNDLNVKIDWESDICYQPVEIVDYIRSRSTEPVSLRVYANPDTFYAYEFADSDKYQCLKLTFRDSDEHLFGYVERGSPTSKLIAPYFQNPTRTINSRPEPFWLTVRFLEDSKSERGVMVEEFIASRWANLDEL